MVEFRSGNYRIIVDMGLPLKDRSGKPCNFEKVSAIRSVKEGIRSRILPRVPGLYRGPKPRFLAVLLTHYHLDHTGLLRWLHPNIDVYCGDVCRKVTELQRQVELSLRGQRPWRFAPKLLERGKARDIGPFRVTPLLVDHSAFQAFAFIIEADGERVFFSGDIRKHGAIGKEIYKQIEAMRLPPIDCLMLEGTMLSRTEWAGPKTEADATANITTAMQAHPGQLALCSLAASNVTRLTGLYKAARDCGRTLVIDAYTAAILRICRAYAGVVGLDLPGVRLLYLGGHAKIVGEAWGDWEYIGRLKYSSLRIELAEIARNPGAYVLPFRAGLMRHLENHPGLLRQSVHLYSLWEGYRKQREYAPTRRWLRRHRIPEVVEGLHVSGHGYEEDLKELAKIISPTYIVPIHTENPARYREVFKPVPIEFFRDGQEYPVSSKDVLARLHAEQDIKGLTAAAMGGDAEARYLLAFRYFEAEGVTKNLGKARFWWGMAAMRGHMPAMSNLGWCCLKGSGGPVDFQAALLWLRKASAKDDSSAQRLLADMYYEGQGVKKDIGMAFSLWEKAAAHGDLFSQSRIAHCYFYGEGVRADYGKAVAYATLAARQGFPEAQYFLGLRYCDGKGITQDARKARDIFRAAAKQGHAGAQYELAKLYYQGKGGVKDYKAAAAWCNKAAGQGDADSQHTLGFFYRFGRGVRKSRKRALNWWQRAAQSGQSLAQYELGIHFLFEGGKKCSPEEAVRWLEASAKQGHAEAQYFLGVSLVRGRWNVTEDKKEGLRWLRLSAEQSYPRALYELGCLHWEGEAVRKSVDLAIHWWHKAAAQNNEDARLRLGECRFLGIGIPRDVAGAAGLWQEIIQRDYRSYPACQARWHLGTGSSLPRNQVAIWVDLFTGKGKRYGSELREYFRDLYGACQRDREVLDDFVRAGMVAARQRNPYAYCDIGMGYLDGRILRGQMDKAAYWLAQAAERGNAKAQYELGRLYFEGRGVRKDVARARALWEKAAAQKCAPAVEALRDFDKGCVN